MSHGFGEYGEGLRLAICQQRPGILCAQSGIVFVHMPYVYPTVFFFCVWVDTDWETKVTHMTTGGSWVPLLCYDPPAIYVFCFGVGRHARFYSGFCPNNHKPPFGHKCQLFSIYSIHNILYIYVFVVKRNKNNVTQLDRL